MIISLRGTFGSGKTTVVRTIMERFDAQPYEFNAKAKPIVYKMDTRVGTLCTLGSYETACGGCDTIQPYSDIWPLIVHLRSLKHHILFEGAMTSSSYGTIGTASEVYGDQVVFAFMDTPLEECIRRVGVRRKAKGGKLADKPVNPKTIKDKYDSVAMSIDKIRGFYKRRVVMVDHKRPVSQLLGILYKG